MPRQSAINDVRYELKLKCAIWVYMIVLKQLYFFSLAESQTDEGGPAGHVLWVWIVAGVVLVSMLILTTLSLTAILLYQVHKYRQLRIKYQHLPTEDEDVKRDETRC